MMKHADRVDVIELHAKRQIIDIALDNMNVGKIARILKSHFHGIAEIDADHLTRAKARRTPGMASLAAAGIEDQLVAKEVSTDRFDPIEKLLFVDLIKMREGLPGIAKTSRRLLLVAR